jgi:DNA-binding LacI/PurR family transcriptional regulator
MSSEIRKAAGADDVLERERKSRDGANRVFPPPWTQPLGKRVTIADLARVLGMDKSSVSLALRDSPRVAEATRARVRAAAAEHNYSPNWAAKQLAGTLGHAIGLVMPSTFDCLVHPPVVHTTQALAKLAARRGLTLNLIASEQLAEVSHEPLRPLHADGLLVWGDVPSEETARLSATYARPSIVLDPHHPSYASYPGYSLRIENHAGASMLVRHLAARGAEHLTFVQVVAEHLGHIERWHGTQQTWAEHASPATLERVALDHLTDDHLKRIADRKGAAIFCSNDRGAMQLWHRLHELGISIPTDVKLAGFDGDEYGALVGLTTALFDSEALAEKAFMAIWGLIKNNAAEIGDPSVPVVLRRGSTS